MDSKLFAICKLNEGNIRDDIFYKYVYGDKETFWMGFDMARQHYYLNWKPYFNGYHIDSKFTKWTLDFVCLTFNDEPTYFKEEEQRLI
ncbi:hypothetical protein PIROE2DRAFT_8059 [Piromyces sp. E2]|nr:hypothetical protein PIROE2DRAFT_8059 [Piromyces sp. E2]|eukprot:OUM64996.1 hypothetical protein PIROE2DRAFT_8059 [Piromyces sp. E2]